MNKQEVDMMSGSKYYLNYKATEDKLVKGANSKDFISVVNGDNSYTLTFSTGSYVIVVMPLLKFWKETTKISSDDTDGLETEVLSVETKVDKAGTIERHTVKLQVEDEVVTITLYDTTLKILVQGGSQQVQFTTRALIPFLVGRIRECDKNIQIANASVANKRVSKSFFCSICGKGFNTKVNLKIHMGHMHTTGDVSIMAKPISSIGQRRLSQAAIKQTRMVNRNRQMFQSDQQLSDTNMSDDTNTSVVSELLNEIVHEVPTITALKDQTDVVGEGDPMHSLQQRLEAPSMDLEVRTSTPSFSSTFPVSSSHHRQSVIMRTLAPKLQLFVPSITPPVPLCPGAASFYLQKSLPPLSVTDTRVSQRMVIPTIEIMDDDYNEDYGNDDDLEKWVDSEHLSNLAGNILQSCPEDGDPTDQSEAIHTLPVHVILETEKQPDIAKSVSFPQLQDPEPGYRNLGDHLDSMDNLMKSMIQKQNFLQLQMVGMRQKIDLLHNDMKQRDGNVSVDVEIVQESSNNRGDFECHECNFISSQITVMSKHTIDKHPQQVKPRKKGDNINNDQSMFKCTDCRFIAINITVLDTHIAAMHSRPHKVVVCSTQTRTLMIGDSHLKSINPRMVERAVGGRLFTPGYTRPKVGRAYCSTRDWPGARFPENNITDMLPQLLNAREYTDVIVLAPSTDISNLKDITNSSMETVHNKAVESSINTVAAVEAALRDFPSLKSAIIVERLPRTDSMADISEFSNFALRGLVDKSALHDRMSVLSLNSIIPSSQVMEDDMYGSSFLPNYDGIHLRGKAGTKLFTRSIVEGLRSVGCRVSSDWQVVSSNFDREVSGLNSATRMDRQRESVITMNRFSSLSN
jgi:hypothetical protein